MEHLIANTGIQFITNEVEFNPNEQLILKDGKPLKYSFLEYVDELLNLRIFDLLSSVYGAYVPLNELRQGGGFEVRPNGEECIDTLGLTKPKSDIVLERFSHFQAGAPGVFTISSLTGYTVPDLVDGRTKIPAFELLLNKWLPMPMFEKNVDGYTLDYPVGWCRMKIERIGEGSKKNSERYRLIWAFDTTLSEDPFSSLRPTFADSEDSCKKYSLCNCAYELFDFLSTTDENGKITAFSEYIYAMLGRPKDATANKYIAYYIYFVNFLRLSNCSPEVTLHNSVDKTVPVDLVLDIGNSRTCGVLFEEGDFRKGHLLKLRDLTYPHLVYDKSFDMRFVFRQADFGNDIVLQEDIFKWYSFVRVGDEAKHLVYRSLEQNGLSSLETNYSSPKRYLWDNKPFEGHWENLVKEGDAFNVQQATNVYIPKLSEMFDNVGNYVEEGSTLFYDIFAQTQYSRSSLMKFVLIEIFQQAIAQINSPQYRNHNGDIDRKRVLRNIILTCPTAMPVAEQTKLRRCAEVAYDAIQRCIPHLGNARIVPNSKAILANEDEIPNWNYDEATCCQLTYLYSEIAQRYSGSISKFFEMKGHVRKEDKESGYEGKSLTIGTIDIGAGTTDVMVSSYQCKGNTTNELLPKPLYWDSFYLAGDDIIRNLIQDLIIEGNNMGSPNLGNIRSAVLCRINKMSDAEIVNLPCIKNNKVYAKLVSDITDTVDADAKALAKQVFVNNLMCDFFGNDSAGMGHKARRCRLDFNTQVSVPLSQMYLELLRLKRPTRVYSFDEIFTVNKPAKYLLDYFAEHFGFRFEELQWRFEPAAVAEIVKSTLEPLMKQLAVVLYAQKCDIIVLAGRPTSLDAVTELFVKYIPTSPDKLIRLNEYRIGNWFPTATGEGYFYDQKSIVAVGAMVGFLATTSGLPGFALDMSVMNKKMVSTARFLGCYNTIYQQVKESVLTPTKMLATIDVPTFPVFIGCKQFDSPLYQARPLYAIYSKERSLKVTLTRNYDENRECIMIEEVQNEMGEQLPVDVVELVQQSLVDDKRHWLDKGAFTLTIN